MDDTFVGKRIEQVRAEAPEWQKYVGRQGVVDAEFDDEKGQRHVRTEDGMWCPARLVSVIG